MKKYNLAAGNIGSKNHNLLNLSINQYIIEETNKKQHTVLN